MGHKNHIINGVKVPSVTEVLQVVHDPKLLEMYGFLGFDTAEQIMETAAKYGREVHHAIDCLLNKKPVTVEGHQKEMVNFVQDWMKEKKVKCLYTEQSVDNDVDMYGGTADIICRFGKSKELWLGDWKTSSKIRVTYPLQLAAYAAAANRSLGLLIDNGFILRMDKKPKGKTWWEVEYYEHLAANYYPAFKAALEIWRYLNRGKSNTPAC